MREGKRGGPRASPGGDVIHVHPTFICLPKRFWAGLAREVVSLQLRDVDCVSFL